MNDKLETKYNSYSAISPINIITDINLNINCNECKVYPVVIVMNILDN